MNDFDEFCGRVGTEKVIYRYCELCDDLIIVSPHEYDGPKVLCDVDDCIYFAPICVCEDELIYDFEEIAGCSYPNCPGSR